MKQNTFTLLFLICCLCGNSLFGQQLEDRSPKKENTKKSVIWADIDEKLIPNVGTRYISATSYRTVKLNLSELSRILNSAPMEFTPIAEVSKTYLPLPMPDGSIEIFDIVESPIMEAGLHEKFPEINTYAGYSTENPGKYLRLDLTPQGFHAMVLVAGGKTVFIDPYSFGGGDAEHYIVYNRKDFVSTVQKTFDCSVTDYMESKSTGQMPNLKAAFGSCELRTYRLALAATGEYTAFHGGTVAGAQAAQVTTMNRVNGVYEREMAIRMNIIANNNLLIYTNSATDPYTNNNGGTMLGQNQTTCDNVIGSANYDIGHVFSTGGGGVAYLQSVCNNGNKAGGVTGSGSPVGDAFDIDYVAHEMGHQFGCNHTQNNNCNRNNATAMEPGSASTIMGYAGICAPDVQNNSDDYFHGISLQEMGAFITGGGHTCPVETPLANSAPNVTASATSVTIPQGTPFFLTASATDPNGSNVLTYCWEQMNNQTATMPPVATATGGPNFRSFDPTTNPTRYFPNLASLATNGPFTWEVLPTVARTMNFRVTVRDNAPGGGCTDHEDITVAVSTAAGPFVVTNPTNTGISYAGNSTQTITWNVAGTTASPVSCANVDILISTDGGVTYTVLLANTPNDGTQALTIPNTPSTTCRIMVRCANGYFFDISNNNFTITAATFDYTLSVTSGTVSVCQPNSAVYNINVGSIGGFSNNVTLSVTGVPAGATASFGTNPVTPPGTSTLTINNTGSAAPGTYTLTLSGNSTTGIKNVVLTLNISAGAPAAVTLLSPANAATGVSIPAALSWTAATGTGVSYFVEISTSPTFVPIIESANVGTNSYSATLLSATTTYYWRVTASTACGTAPVSSTFSFTTASCATFTSTNVPVTISGTGTPTVTSTVNVTGLTGTITDVNVTNLVGTHTYISDLTFRLTSPSATNVTLFDQVCADEDNWDVKFDDAAASATLPCPPVGGGTYRPQGTLSSFNGQNPTGNWTLTIIDNFDADGGALTAWAIEVCTAVPTLNNDAGISAIINPTTAALCGNPFTPEVTLTNFGVNTLTSCTINYRIDAAAPQTYNWTGSLASGAATNVILNPITSPTTGVPITFRAYTSNPNATTDPNNSNDTSSVVTQVDLTVPLPYSENFNAGSMPTNITILNPDTDAALWEHNTASNSGGGAGGSSRIDNYNNDTRGTIDWEILPAFDFSGQSGVEMTFDVAYARYDATYSDTLIVAVNDDCGTTYSVIYLKGGSDLATRADLNTGIFTPTSTQWRKDTVDLSAYDNLPAVKIAFINLGGYGQRMYLDNINIQATVTCIMTSSITGSTNVLCNGASTGSATVTPVSGTAPYTYLWSNAATGATANNLAAGTYTVTVTDNSGCTSNSSVTITQPTAMTSSTTSTTNVLCNGAATGAFTVAASGGTPSYLFNSGTGNQANGTFTGLTAGTYNVTITDNNGCTTTRSVTITQPTALSSSTTSTTNAACNGGSTGAFTVAASGGTAPYQFNTGSGNQAGGTFTGLNAGTYNVTITDNNGCTTTRSVTITQPTALSSSTTSTTNVACNGGATGAFTVAASGGTPTYQFNRGTGNQAGGTFTGLTAGTYNVTITDANGCTTTRSVTITQPTAMSSSTTSTTNVTCNGSSTGAFTVAASGGTSPYQFNTGSGNQAGGTFTGLTAGTYNVTITDANGCITTRSVTITQPTAVSGTTTSSGESCAGNDGTASVTAGGGTSPYSFAWSNGGNTAAINSLAAGSYTVTITDNSGCSTTRSVVVANNCAPCTVGATSSSNNASCNGVCNGSITITPSGGTAPYSFTWGDGATTSSRSSLCAGVYDVTVVDASACTASQSVTITEPTAINGSTSSSTNVSCNGASTGAFTMSASGGTSPYQFNNGAGNQGSGTFTGLAAGTYTVTITDNSGCTATGSATITQPTALSSSTTSTTNVSCNGGSDGTFTVSASGGTSPYQFNAGSGNQAGGTFSNMTAGNYNVTTTDNNGCTTTHSITITQPTALSAATSSTGESCAGNDGTASANASGGTAPYSFAWSNGGNTSTIASLATGSYSYTVTDANGCTTNGSVVVADNCSPCTISSTTSSSDASCNGVCDGSISVTPTTGTAPYTFTWGDGATTATRGSLCAGTYDVTITDSGGCIGTESITITAPAVLNASVSSSANATCNGSNDGDITVSASGGTAPYQFNIGSGNQASGVFTGLAAGSYNVTVTDNNGCTNSVSATITEPTAMTATGVGTNPTSSSNNDGNIDLTVSGGTAPYTFVWSTGATTEDVSGLGIGNYTVTVTDGNGCSTVQTVSLVIVGIDKIDNVQNFQVLPNPNNGAFVIQIELANAQDAVVELVDVLGRHLREWNFTQQQRITVPVDISEQAGGMYLIILRTTDGKLQTRKVTVGK